MLITHHFWFQISNLLKFMKNKKIVILFLIIYLLSTTISYAFFLRFKGAEVATEVEKPISPLSEGFEIDTSAPKTEECPLNGEMRTKQERERWEKRRPLGIMVENHLEARPQSGLSSADIVYEAVAEGGITRFLAIFYCQDSKIVGPVRSARTYYLDFISEYGDKPLYAHVGGANTPGPADALGQIADYGWLGLNDLNQFSIGFPTFWRDYERLPGVATEHTMYTSTERLWSTAKKRGLTNVDGKGFRWDQKFTPWSFKDDLSLEERPDSFIVEFPFWEGYKSYSVKWVYEKETNSYKRFNGGTAHKDKNNNKQLTAKTIILTFMTETNANDGYENNAHLLYGTKGSGKAIVLLDGKRVEGTWQKKDRLSRMKFFNKEGNEIKLNRGQIWIEILPIGVTPEFS